MKQPTLADYTERMLRVLVHIQQHLDEETPLAELAGVAAFSPYHFHRIFRGMVGEPVGEYIRRLRLERAAARLKHGALPIVEIAFEAGYESHEAFTRSFKALLGVTPSAFRTRRTALAPTAMAHRVEYGVGGAPVGFRPSRSRGGGMKVEIMTRAPVRAAFVRHVGPYDQCGRAWETLCTALGPEGHLAGAELVGLCHDDPDVTPPDKVRYDACCTVDDGFEPRGGIGCTVIAGGDYARATHFGPFHLLGTTYARLFGEWLPRSGRELRSAPALEIYLTDPESTEPEDLVTDIYAPLEAS